MARNDIRLHNLRALIAEFGSIARLAEAADVSEKYLSQLNNRATMPSGTRRKIGDTVAEKLERGTGKPSGWMDTDRRGTPTVDALNGTESELLRLYRKSDPAYKRAIMAVARLADL